jgi:tripartite-type tricarboxylate transporter receptor subunit TctC
MHPATLRRRAIVVTALAGAALPARAQTGRTVSLVVPAPPGGHTDIAARLLADALPQRTGGTAIVDNRPGGNGVVGAQAVLRARADGTTVFVAFSGFMTGIPAVTRDLGMDPQRDLLPVAMLMEAPHVVLVPASLGTATLADFVAHVRARRGALNYASVGVGSIHHLGAELLKQRAQLDLTHVPYRGDAPALQDLLTGRVHMYFATLPAALGFVRDGQVRALAVAAPQRLAMLPDVPTLAESGVRDLDVASWYALYVARGTPAEAAAALAGHTNAITASAAFRARATELGSVVVPLTPEQMAARATAELATWAQVVRTAGIELL